jgi:glycogen synthase
MKIAFISYEYPPDTSYGGIATYVKQASQLLCQRGHHVEVFAASPDRCGTEVEEGILVQSTLAKYLLRDTPKFYLMSLKDQISLLKPARQ